VFPTIDRRRFRSAFDFIIRGKDTSLCVAIKVAMRTTRLVRRWSPSRASANVACAHSGADNSIAVFIMAWFLSLFSMSFILSPLSSNCLRRQKSSPSSFFLFRDDFSFLFTLSSSLNSFF